MSDTSTRGTSYLGPAEFTLGLLTFATVLGFARVFADWSFVGPMIAVGLYTHLLCLYSRRRGWSIPFTALVGVPVLLLLLTWVFFFNSTMAGIPNGSTVDAVREALNQSWETFQNVTAPAPALSGFVMAACAALFFAVFLADWAAFRLWSAFEAVVPASTLFIFCSLLGSPQYQIPSTVIFCGALFIFLLFHRIARQETSAGWLTADIARGSRALATTGLVLTAITLLLGAVLGPRLPGATSPAMVSWRGQDSGPGSRVTISPLVDIQDRLTTQSNLQLFTVTSNQRSYWRMTSLDTFEGDIWRSGGKYATAGGDLDCPDTKAATQVTADQRYTIQSLKVLWVPAAYEPCSIDSPDAPVRYQAESSTLIVDNPVADSDGLSYAVSSRIGHLTAAELKAATGDYPSEIKDRYLALPKDFSAVARSEATRITGAAATPYEKALALQNYFQSPPFTYDLAVPRGHGENAIEEFLRDKRGYCEQYAGTYTAMARAVGLPARVAVGFTPGEFDPATNTYMVKGEHAHAWPEIYLNQFGWVAFEPTPGRGAPNAEDYTGLPERQQTPSVSENTTTTSSAASTPSVVTTQVPVAPGSVPDKGVVEVGPPPDQPSDGNALTRALGWAVSAVGVVVLTLILVAVYASIVISMKQRRRAARRRHATDPSAIVRVSWDESVEQLERLGTYHRPAETHEEFASRAGPALAEQGQLLTGLARDADAAAYAAELVTDDVAERATSASTTITDTVDGMTSRWSNLRYKLDPRPLFPKRRGPRRHRAGSAK